MNQENLEEILGNIDISGEAPVLEPDRQYYFMKKAWKNRTRMQILSFSTPARSGKMPITVYTAALASFMPRKRKILI